MWRKRLVLIALSIMLTACGGLVGRSVKTIDGSSTTVPFKKELGAFNPIEGTNYQLASISLPSQSGSRYDFSQLFSSGRSDYGVYNYVFLDVKSESVYALLPNNDDMILSIQGYPVPNASVEPKIFVKWWLYTLAKDDTNKDEQLSYLDQKTLAISDAGGKGYTELISGVDDILGDVYKDGNILLLLYRSNGKNFLAHVDLAARKVSKTTALPSFGEDVK